MDSETYMNTYYAEDVLTNRPHSSLEYTAAQQDIEAKNIKGAVDFKQFESDIKALVYVSEKSDFSTFVHEAAHVARRTMSGELLLKAEKAFGVEGGKWTRAQEERFAKGFEQYLREGKAPSEELKTVFQKAAEFLSRIYKSLKEILHINDEIRAVYDELLGVGTSGLHKAEKASAKKTGQTDGQKVFIKTLIKSVEEVKKALESIKNTDITNESTGITARISSTGINKMTSNKAVEKSEANGFTRNEHYGAAAEIKTLYEKARLIGEHADRNADPNIKSIKRFLAPIELERDINGEALITLKETEEHGHRIYSLELEEIKPADKRSAVAQNAQPVYSGSASKGWETTDTHARKTAGLNAPDEHTVKDLQEKSKGYEETVKTAYEEAGAAARLAEEKKRYENEVIAWYKEHHSGADGEEIKELIKKEAARQRMSFEEYVKAVAKERQTLNGLDEQGAVFFQTEPVTEEEMRFKEAADAYREGVERFFDGKLQSSEVLTVTRRTPVILRAVGFEDKPITVTGETLKHITAHEEISKEILKTLPEEFLNPVAVFKSQKEDKPNSRLIFTEHIINNKPVLIAVEMNYKENRTTVTSIRSMYKKDRIKVVQKWIDDGNILYLDDKRAESFSTSTGLQLPLTGSHQLINPSAANIGENGKNVNRDFLTKPDIIGENADAIYFQVEKDFFNEVQGETEEETKENIEKIIVGLDSEHAVNLFYTSEEERALADKAYRDAISPELEKALQKDIKDEKVKNETFLKMMENREAVKAFLKQTAQAEKRGLYGEFLKETGGGFITLAHRIAEGKPLTDKQTGILNKYINGDIASYRNLFAELNGFTALRSLTESEKAFTEAFARAKAEGGTEKVKPKTRAEIQDKMFLEEMADDEKFNAFLNEAASAYFFDFKNFKAQDAEDAAYRNEVMRKNERVNREMRNFSWKAAFAKIHHGKEVSAKTLSNIKGQIRNAPRSYRSLYADIMGRDDMRVRDAESTDAIIKTKLKSRPSARFKAEELKLENMSPSEKQRIIKALDNEEMERRVLNGTITVDDAEKMREAARLKNAEIKVLEKKIKSLEEKFESEKAIDGTVIEDLKKKLRFEKLTRKVLRDVAKANEAACKGVMRRINIKECSAEIAEGLAAAQWFLRGKVQKALRATHAEVEERIREGYALWKTSEAYRQKLTAMSSHKRNWKAVLNLLDGKDFDEWTAEDKKLARSVIPMRNKFFSLGLDKKTSRNFEEMRTADLTAEQKEEEALKILPSHIFAKLKNEPLSRWTVDELLELNAVINEKYAEGKKKYAAVQAEKRYADAQIRESVIKTLLKTKGYKETAAAWSEDEKEKKRGLTSLLRSGKYTAMRPYAFMEMLDGGRQGVMYDVFEYEKRECGNRLKQGVEAQINEFTGLLNSLGVDVSYFEEKTVFKDFYIKKEKGDLTGQDKNDLTLKKGEILGVYLASFDEKSLMAVQYGNFAEQQERDMARQTGSTGALDSFSEARLRRVLKEAERLMAEDEAFKAAAEFMQAHYKKEGARLKEHNRRVNNEITEIRDYYFPMLRLDGSGEEDPRITRKKIVGEYSTGTRQGVEKGQTKSRIDIGAANQTAIDVNAVSAFFKSVEANQKLYAFDEYAQKLNRLVKGYDSKNFRRILENARGREAVSYLDKQVNAIINPSSGRVFSDTDKVLRSLRGAAAPAYLGWKMSGIIKQGLTSPAPFMQYLNPLEYAKAALDLAFNRKENLDFIYSRSTLMKNRSFDIMKDLTDALAKEAKTKAGKALTRFQQAGMKGLEMIDAVCVAPGWLASYRKEEARLLKENKTAASPLSGMQIDLAAARFADDVLVRTQPSGEVSDLAPLFREGGEALKLLLQFQSSLNVIYNNIRHDLPNAVRQKQYKRAAGIAAGYALAGIAVGAVCEGFGGEDEEEADKVRRAVFYAFTQGTDSVPIVSSMVTGLTEKAITGKTGYRGSSNIFAAFEKFAQGSASLRDADFKKAAVRYGESAGLVLGLPTSGAKEAYRAAEQVFNGELPSALWGRR